MTDPISTEEPTELLRIEDPFGDWLNIATLRGCVFLNTKKTSVALTPQDVEEIRDLFNRLLRNGVPQ